MTSGLPIYGISDLHLPIGTPWTRHGSPQTLISTWRRELHPDGLLLLPGDLLHQRASLPDLPDLLEHIPCQKLIVPGNHDHYLHPRNSLPGATILKGTAMRLQPEGRDWGIVICGTQGSTYRAGHPRRNQALELRRLASALSHAKRLRRRGDGLICLLHHPPATKRAVHTSPFTRLLRLHDVDLCCFGHAHGPHTWTNVFQGRYGSCHYQLVAADYLDWQPQHIATAGKRRLYIHT